MARLSPLTAAVACDSKLRSIPPAENEFAAELPEVPVALASATPLPKMLRREPLPPSAVAVALAAPLPTDVADAVVLPPSPPGPELALPPFPPMADRRGRNRANACRRCHGRSRCRAAVAAWAQTAGGDRTAIASHGVRRRRDGGSSRQRHRRRRIGADPRHSTQAGVDSIAAGCRGRPRRRATACSHERQRRGRTSSASTRTADADTSVAANRRLVERHATRGCSRNVVHQ